MRSLSWDADSQAIGEFFDEKCGGVESVNLLTGFDGKSKGIAFVRFESVEHLEKACELNGVEWMGRNIVVEKTKPKGERPVYSNAKDVTDEDLEICVRNLSFNTDSDSLRSFFEAHGNIVNCRVVTDRESGRSKGFGFVKFSSSDEVKKALTANGQEVDGRAIRLEIARRRDGPGGAPGGRPQGGRGGPRGGNGKPGMSLTDARPAQKVRL